MLQCFALEEIPRLKLRVQACSSSIRKIPKPRSIKQYFAVVVVLFIMMHNVVLTPEFKNDSVLKSVTIEMRALKQYFASRCQF